MSIARQKRLSLANTYFSIASSKKRPHTLTFSRTFAFKIFDMLELYVDPDSVRYLSQFKTSKAAIGLSPLLLFSGTPFESPIPNEYTMAKSIFTDFFKTDANSASTSQQKIDVEGLQYIVSISARDTVDGEDDKPKIHLRVYKIITKKSGQKNPRVELEEVSCDFFTYIDASNPNNHNRWGHE